MTISVVMPVRNDAAFLQEALESIRSQTLAPAEVILVDGGSADGTRDIAERFGGVTLLAQRGPTLGDAYNEGVEAARHPLVAFHAGDDVWMPDKLERQVALLERTGARACVGLVDFFLDGPPPPGFRHELLAGARVARIAETLLAQRSLFAEFGGWRSAAQDSGDVDWYARIQDAGIDVPAVDAVVLRKRVHAGSNAHTSASTTPGLLEAARASIARKRAAAGSSSP